MRTLTAQLAMSITVLMFAVLAVRVSGALSGHARRYAYAWALTGWAFMLEGANSFSHDLFSLAGFLGGPDSAAWKAVLRWHPVLNHSRTFLLTTFCLVLVAVMFRSGRGAQPPTLRRAMLIVAGGMLLGALVGWFEPTFTNRTHYSAVALFDIMELFALMAVLAVGITSGGMDRALWFALGLNMFVIAMSVLLFAAVAEIDVVGQWVPSPLHVQVVKTGMHFGMVVIAWVHLRRIAQGRPVRGLMDPPLEPAGLTSMHP